VTTVANTINSSGLQPFLGGIDDPTSKSELIETARSKERMSAAPGLEQLPEQKYTSPTTSVRRSAS